MRFGRCALLGLFVLAASAVQAQNLVVNPGFETGDFTGWTVTGGADPIVDVGIGHTGMYAASLGAIAPDVVDLSQMLATQSGQQYTLTFYAQTPEFNNPPGFPNSLTVYFGDSLIDGPLTVPDDPDYQKYSYTVTATSGASLLHFAVSNDPDYTQLDDISVVAAPAAVPEPGPLGLLLGGGIGGVWLQRRRRR
jgi:hypothetical protein